MTTWHTLGWVADVRAGFGTIPGAPPFPDADTFLKAMNTGEWYNTEFVQQQLATHGFEDVKVEIVPTTTHIESAAVYVEQYLPMYLQFTAKFWSDEDREKYSGSAGPALLKYMTEKYGEGKAFELKMVAIVSTARKP
jgi:hypothetical protein